MNVLNAVIIVMAYFAAQVIIKRVNTEEKKT